MKQIASKLFFAVLIFCLPGLSLGQTSLSGTISSDSTLTLAGSPYTLTEAFGVSAGYELTIEPGVSINGNFEVTIEGTLVMEGTATDSIFVDNTRFKFTKTNLDSSSIQYISFKGLSGVMIGNRLSSAGNNTGQLHLSKSTFYSNSRVEAWGYLSNASSILISESKFYDARVEGDLQEGEIIYLEDCDLYDSFVSSEDYHSGIFLRNSRIEESSFFSDCCGANINFDLCTITSSIMGTGDVNIDSSLLYETNFSRRGGTLQLTNSRLEGLGTLEQRDYLFAKPALVIDNCIIDAKGNDYGMIELYGGGTLFEVKNSTFIGFTDVIYSVKRLPHTITNNNFIDFEGYAIEHRGNNDLDARGNYWDYDSTVLSEIFFDKLDDLAYGLVDYSEYLDEPTDQLPALPPTEVYKGLQGGEVLLSWTAVSNSQLGGYRVYEQSGEDLELLGEVDAQTTQFTKEGISLSGEYVVVSYKTGADGEDDFREGNVSSESEPAEVYFTESDISAQYCEGDSVAFSVLSTTLDASETYQVQISQSEDFASPINLGTLDSATLTMTVALPDTLMADASYQLRVLAETADVYVSSQELVYRTFPSASFTALDSICYQDTLTVTYAEAADANATYAWDFDLGVIQSGSDSGPIEVAWSDAGEKNIHLSVNRYGCIAESDEKVYITEELVSDFTTTALVCEGNTADVTVSSPPVSESVFTWDWDGATNTSSTTAPSLVWDTFGEKTISLSISQNGCSSETSVQIVSYQATPTPSISLPANQACNGEEMELTYDGDQLENLSLTWEIMGAEEVSTTGDTIITIKWTAEGPQTVEVMADLAGCLASATDTVTVNPIPSSSFSAPTEVCEGSSAAIAYLGNAGENANFVWVWDGADTVTEGTTAYALTWSTLGDKEVSLVVTEEGCTSDTTRKAIAHTANPTLLFSAAASACREEDYHLEYLGENYDDLNWDFNGAIFKEGSGAGPYVLSFNTAGALEIDFMATNGSCAVDTTLAVLVPEAPTVPSLCLITWDADTEKNKLVWSHEQATVQKFGVYRETNQPEVYELVEYVEPGNDLVYIDQQSSPDVVPNSYKITAVDTCGFETELSDFHTTNLLAIQQVGEDWTLTWTGYEGLTLGSYQVYRSLDGEAFELLTEVASNVLTYTDENVATDFVEYQIGFNLGESCDPNSGYTNQFVFSNVARSAAVTGIELPQIALQVYPNPTQGAVTIQAPTQGDFQYQLVSPLGKIIRSGSFEYQGKVTWQDEPDGIYYLRVSEGNRTEVITILKN